MVYRLTPVYVIIIGFYIWIFPLIGSGPFWNLLIEDSAYCAKNWWMNLLYINNYVVPSELVIELYLYQFEQYAKNIN